MLEPRSAGYGGVSVGRAGDGCPLIYRIIANCTGFSYQNGILSIMKRLAADRISSRTRLPLARRSGYTMGRSIESEKVKLGWTPKVTFNQLVKIMVDAKLQAVEKG